MVHHTMRGYLFRPRHMVEKKKNKILKEATLNVLLIVPVKRGRK